MKQNVISIFFVLALNLATVPTVFSGARMYDPTTGRFTTPDPIGFAGGETNLYLAVKNNPLRFVDPDGHSAKDVNAIRNTFNKYVTNLNNLGLRYPGSPYINNFWATFGAQYLGCYAQAYAVQQKLASSKYDDQWTFESAGSNFPHLQPQSTIGVGLLPHYWLRGISSNPTDPELIIDPWNNIVMPLQGNTK